MLFLFKITDVLKINGIQIISYALIFYGISAVYLSFGENQREVLLSGIGVFCAGLVLFLENNFYFINIRQLLIPSIVMMLSVAAFMLYLDGWKNRILLYISAGLLIVTLVIAKIWGILGFSPIFYAIWVIILSYWPVALIFALVILLLREHNVK
jgi:hypothetical protein